MIYTKKIFSALTILFLLSTNSIVFWAENNYEWKYELYEQNVDTYCSAYKKDKIIHTLNDEKEYPNIDKEYEKMQEEWYIIWYWNNIWDYFWSYISKTASDDIDEIDLAKVLYRKRMDKIYNCATTLVYTKTIDSIKTDIKWTPELTSKLEKKLDRLKEDKIKNLSDEECKVSSEINDIYIKNIVLEQSTYELCKYNYYLNYLHDFNKDFIWWLVIWKVVDSENKPLSTKGVLEQFDIKSSRISIEITDSFEVFPKVFEAYSQYENFLILHLYLDLVIKQDYLSLREMLHRTLNPLNQLWYRIINAMSK